MSQELTYETIEAMKLESGDLVVVKRDEGSLPIVLEGFMGGLARAFPDNTFVILPPGMSLEKVKAEELKDLIENADGFRTPAIAYKIKSNGRTVDTKITAPDGKRMGLVQEMYIEIKVADPLVRVKLLRIATDEDGKIITEEPPMAALDLEIPADQVEITSTHPGALHLDDQKKD